MDDAMLRRLAEENLAIEALAEETRQSAFRKMADVAALMAPGQEIVTGPRIFGFALTTLGAIRWIKRGTDQMMIMTSFTKAGTLDPGSKRYMKAVQKHYPTLVRRAAQALEQRGLEAHAAHELARMDDFARSLNGVTLEQAVEKLRELRSEPPADLSPKATDRPGVNRGRSERSVEEPGAGSIGR